MHKKPLLVSTDLDGTLLDHFTYSWQAAVPSIEALKVRDIPVVINTSKTFFEVLELQKNMGLAAPFIVENGSAIYFPKAYAYKPQDNKTSPLISEFNRDFDLAVLGVERETILKILKQLKSNFKFQGFDDWDVDTIISHTGLDRDSATLAAKRQFSEPIIWQDSDDNFQKFQQASAAHNLHILKGGRFVHILGRVNKGQALRALASILFGQKSVELICLGDSHNDLDMLNIADYPVWVRSPKHDFPDHQCQSEPYYTSGFGPEGWNEAITKVLTTISAGVKNG